MWDKHSDWLGEDAMRQIKQFVHRAWTRISISRYRQKQVAMERRDRDVLERLEHQENGGSPYGPPPMGRMGF